jgi:hypothetical protein
MDKQRGNRGGSSARRPRRKYEARETVPLAMGENHDHARTTVIAVRPGAALKSRQRLFTTLESAYPVAFRVAEADSEPAAAEIHFAPSDRLAQRPPAAGGRPVLVLGDEPWFGAAAGAVRCGGAVDRRLRGLTLTDPLDGPEPADDGEAAVLAENRGKPVWTRTLDQAPVSRVASALPELGAEQSLRELLFERPLAMAALITFLRETCADDLPQPPPLRAALVFDDPNLRWRSYGYIEFARLLAHADEHDYHASMAMIPLDARRQHRPTVELFRSRPDRLSLVMHGNNHLSRELLRTVDERKALAAAAQAVRRAEKFEARNDLPMDRVMMPPHGMCSASSAAALAAVGFDALCAIHPLPWLERPPADRPLAGWEPAEFAAGCAVIPRLPLGVGAVELALRAFLDQPLVVYGHHGDVAAGLEPLAETAAAINSLGPVEWCSPGRIASSNSATRLVGDVLHVDPWSHRLRLEVPAGAHRIAVDEPRQEARHFAGWELDGGWAAGFGEPVPLERSETVTISLRPQAAVDPEAIGAPQPSLWPLLRRTATEARDRLQPLLGTGAS